MLKKIAGACIVTLSIQAAAMDAPAGYVLEATDKGIEVFVEENASSPTGIKQYFAKTEVKASVEQILALFTSASVFPHWVDKCSSGTVSQGSKSRSFVTYQTYDMPWPVKDRDFVWEVDVKQDEKGYLLTLTDLSSTYTGPTNDGLIRGRMVSGFYRLIPRGEGRTLVVSSHEIDPAGRLPSWLINSMLTQGPLNTLSNMKEILEGGLYEEQLNVRSGFVQSLLHTEVH